jgi:hypothetical protein
MVHPRLPAAIAVLLLMRLCGSCWASDDAAAGPEKIAITTSIAPREARDYKIDAVVKGKAPSPESGEPTELNATFQLKVRHQYARREGDGLLPLEISLLEGQATVQGQKLEITPSIYPKLTVLIDRDWSIMDIFGMSSAQVPGIVPGIGYSNHIMLFLLPGGDQPRVPSDKWEFSVRIPSFGETYSFTNTLVGGQTVDGIRAAVVRQEIVRPPKQDAQGMSTSMKATAQSVFAIDGGRLLKSHVECEVTFRRASATETGSTSRQDNTTSRANIKIDISPAKG